MPYGNQKEDKPEDNDAVMRAEKSSHQLYQDHSQDPGQSAKTLLPGVVHLSSDFNMIHRIGIIFTILTGLLLVPAVLGTDNIVPRDGTVYIGEADLDLSNCNVHTGDEIAWWESGNPQGTPTARGRIEDVRRFTVDPETFKGHAGAWYGLINKKLVFNVEEPFLQLDINENGMDTQPDSIKRGNLVSFKISTNLAGLSKRAGSSGATVTINMSGPNETEYHTLTSTRTNEFNLDKVYVYTTPYDTGAVWDTSDAEKFPDGDYTFSASTNVNRINEILPESGISYTDKRTYKLGKTEVKPTTEETEKPVKSSSKKDELSAESTKEATPTETPDDEEKTVKKSVKSEKVTDEETTEPTPEETSSAKKYKKASETGEPTDTPTPEETSSTKKYKKASETGEPTDTPTPEETSSTKNKKIKSTVSSNATTTIEETETPTPRITEIPTTEPTTEEPTAVITPHATKTPYPRPPGPGASPTKASPLPVGIIVASLAAGAALIHARRRE